MDSLSILRKGAFSGYLYPSGRRQLPLLPKAAQAGILDDVQIYTLYCWRKVGFILKKLAGKVILGLLVGSLVTTSFGGSFASAVLAAEPEVAEQQDHDNNGITTGIIALGLLALLAKGGSHGGDGDAAKATTPQTTNPQTTNSGSNAGSVSTASGNVKSAEQEAFNLLNADRTKNGLPALKMNSQLGTLAENYAKDMVNRNFFSHYNPEGQSPFDRMNQAGIKYSYAGENLAINTSPAAAETAFMNSSGHRANILNTNYTDVGLGVAYDSNGRIYVVQEFIKP